MQLWDAKACLIVNNSDGASYIWDSLMGESVVRLDTWTHVAGSFDRGEMKVYVNGELEGSKVSATIKNTTRGEYDCDYVSVGGCRNPRHLFDGAIEEVAIFSRALTRAEIRAVMSADSLVGSTTYDSEIDDEAYFRYDSEDPGAVASGDVDDEAFFLDDSDDLETVTPVGGGLVLWLRADRGVMRDRDGFITRWKDQSGMGNNAYQAARTRMPRLVTDSTTGKETVSFDGTNDLMSISHSASLDLTREMTVAAWVRLERSETSPGVVILAKYSWAGEKRTWLIQCDQKTLKSLFAVHAPIGGGADTVWLETPPKPRTWHHLAGVLRPGRTAIYLNGRLEAEKKSALTSLSCYPDVPVQIGWALAGSGRDYLRGAIDDIRIYNRALSQAELRELMTAMPFAGPTQGKSQTGP